MDVPLATEPPRAEVPAPVAWGGRSRIVWFFVLTYLLAWLWLLPIAVAGGRVTAGRGWPTHVLALMAPLVAALVVTARFDGRAGLAHLGRRMVRVRVPLRWWAFALSPLLVLGLVLLVDGVSGRALPLAGDFARFSGLPSGWGVLGVGAAIVVGGFGEEAGWRGYALPQLQRRHAPLAATLVVAALWAAWHLPMFLVVEGFRSFTGPVTAGWVLGLFCGAVVLTWLYNRTGSILLAAVWHGTYNIISGTSAATGLLAALSTTLVITLAVVLVVLEVKSTRTGHASVLGPAPIARIEPLAPISRTRGRRLKKVALTGGAILMISTLGLAGLLVWWSPGAPAPFLDAAGRPLAGSISQKVSVDINGVQQGMVIRGEDQTKPVLLWVHGGPGVPDYFLTQNYPPGLEDLFTVVWWDQRGAGLSYHPGIPRESMTVDQLVSDTLAVTDYLRHRFHQDKIYLLGHSWGSFIAIQAAARSPQRYKAYLGMGQITYQLESERLAYDYLLAQYRRRGDTDMVRDLEGAPVTLSGGTPAAYLKVRDKAMHQLGVGTTHDMRSVITGIFLASWQFRGYTLPEKVNLWRGKALWSGLGLWDQLLHVDLRTTVPRLDLPVYFFEGKYDYTVSATMAAGYLQTLHAPVKGFYQFDDSAHSPILEQPDLAHRILAADVLTGSNTLSDKG